MTYQEPIVSFLVLDFMKPEPARRCLESIKRHVKFPSRTIYLHNGPADYAIDFLDEGLVDHFIQTRRNQGLGLGTRDLFAASFSPLSILLQNDQYLSHDIHLFMVETLANLLGTKDEGGKTIASISLAGPVGGAGVYSERCHMISTQGYKDMERGGVLGHYGAGPYHDGPWREAQIQAFYKEHNLTHYTPQVKPWVVDNGFNAVRENPDGSVWEHRPDTKQLRLLKGPIKERHVYPKFSDGEWEFVLANQTWPEWQIPEDERKDSFHVWN